MRFGKSIIACLLAGSLCFGGALISVHAEQQALCQKLIRLHVLGASDSAEDQAAKLHVRDAVLAALPREGWKDRAQAEAELRQLLPRLCGVAEAELRSLSMDCRVTAELAPEYYPTRTYGTFSLPAGEYLSLRILLGEGRGQNWWCVVYPALCTAGTVTDAAAAAGFTEEEISLITEQTAPVRIRFRLLELLRGLRLFAEKRKQ